MKKPENPIQIRPAKPAEAALLSDLALRAKAYWGYDTDFIEACRAELTITEDRIAAEIMLVAEGGDGVIGFAAFSIAEGPDSETYGEVEDVFVETDAIGQGIGGRLMAALVEDASNRGLSRLEVDADPNAVGYYRAQGFTPIGESPSGSIPGRVLPRLARSLGN